MPYQRKALRKVWVMRDEYQMGTRQYVTVLVNEYANGDLLQGTEHCCHVIEGDPFEKCKICGHDITHSSCQHSKRTYIRRCGSKAWFVSPYYGHCLCPDHFEEETGDSRYNYGSDI